MAWFKRTPDEELIAEIRTKVGELQVLARQADARGITVWLRGDWNKKIFRADTVRFDEAYKSSRKNY